MTKLNRLRECLRRHIAPLPREKSLLDNDKLKGAEKKPGCPDPAPAWKRAEDVTTESRISWKDEKRFLEHVNHHTAEAAEFLTIHCGTETDIVPIVTAIRRGCEAAVLYTSRCHLVQKPEDREWEAERACADVKAAINSACSHLSRELVIDVTEAAIQAITYSIRECLPSSTACSDVQAWQVRCIAHARMYSVVSNTVLEQMSKYFGLAPGVGFLD